MSFFRRNAVWNSGGRDQSSQSGAVLSYQPSDRQYAAYVSDVQGTERYAVETGGSGSGDQGEK